ncbi:hypothetical protein Tco_0315776 [Tanacetum coccineum]
MTYSHAVKGNWSTVLRPQQDHPSKIHGDRGGCVTFGGSKGYITGKDRIKVGNLDFDSVSFVKELGHFNLFSISQICDKQHKVLFTESECLVVSPDFKMPDENQILLKVPRQHNMYSFDMKIPSLQKIMLVFYKMPHLMNPKFWAQEVTGDFEECKGGSVTFGGSKGYITGKGRIRVVTLKCDWQVVGSGEEGFLVGYSLNARFSGTSEVTNSAGTLQTPNANVSEEEDEAEELIVVPTAVKHTAAKKEAYSTGISEDTPKILAFRRELDELAQKHLREVPKNKATSTNSVNSGSGQANTQPADQDDSDMPELTIFNKPQKGIFDEASYDDKG